MAIGDVGASSFEAYEGIRILIPGAIVVAVYDVVISTFAPSAPSPSSNLGAAFVAALFVGLVLLFLDLPVKSAAYVNPSAGLPNRRLERWGVEKKRSLNLYLALLDVAIPATIRNRSLYMGSIFRIGFEGLYVVGLTSIAAIGTGAAFPHLGPSRGGTTAAQWVLLALPIALLGLLLGAMTTRVHYRLRSEQGKPPSETGVLKITVNVLHESVAGVGLEGGVATTIGAFAFAVFVDSPSLWYAEGIAVVLPALVWAVLYFRGRVPDHDEVPSRLPPPAGLFLFAVPTTFAFIGAAMTAGATTTLGTGSALSWAVLNLLAALLIVSRGHERKLNGSFASQHAWLEMNKQELIKKYPEIAIAVNASSTSSASHDS